MKLLYLTTWDFTEERTDGVCKKIKAQVHAFKKSGIEVDIIYIKKGRLIYREQDNERVLGRIGAVKKTPAYVKLYRHIKNKKYNWIYNRYGMMDTFYFRVLKRLKENGAGILVEIPTFPYKGERPKGFLYWCMFKWDDIYLKRLKWVVDRLITYSPDEELFQIPTIKIINGINIRKIITVSAEHQLDETIDLLMVAMMQKHHGYERLLTGLYNYKKSGGKRKFLCHFVGEGPEKAYYVELSQKLELSDQVIFYGMKGGEELDDIYEKADIGITSLGAYKDGIFFSSELKSREYLSKGLPIISGCAIDVLHGSGRQFYEELPNDSTPIDMNTVIAFYDRLYKNGRKAVIRETRDFAEEKFDMTVTMKPVTDYMSGAETK